MRQRGPLARAPQSLLREYGECRFKVGEDDDGYSVRMKLKYFMVRRGGVDTGAHVVGSSLTRLPPLLVATVQHYMHVQADDSPLYIFDSSFDDGSAKTILSHYRVPPYFRDDLFRLVGESRRPPYRWFLIGPKRSGTRSAGRLSGLDAPLTPPTTTAHPPSHPHTPHPPACTSTPWAPVRGTR